MGTNTDNYARTTRGAAAREMLLVVGLALAGLILASLVALMPWRIPASDTPVERVPAVVGVVEPIDHDGNG
jgi:hypothetical protein